MKLDPYYCSRLIRDSIDTTRRIQCRKKRNRGLFCHMHVWKEHKMQIKLEVQATPIADAILGQDYPDQALVFNALGKVMKAQSEDDDKHYRWTRHLEHNLDEDGRRFFKDMAKAISHQEDEH